MLGMLPHSLGVSEQYAVALVMNNVIIRSIKPVMPFIYQLEVSWAGCKVNSWVAW